MFFLPKTVCQYIVPAFHHFLHLCSHWVHLPNWPQFTSDWPWLAQIGLSDPLLAWLAPMDWLAQIGLIGPDWPYWPDWPQFARFALSDLLGPNWPDWLWLAPIGQLALPTPKPETWGQSLSPVFRNICFCSHMKVHVIVCMCKSMHVTAKLCMFVCVFMLCMLSHTLLDMVAVVSV
jgi:hypothetical protein